MDSKQKLSVMFLTHGFPPNNIGGAEQQAYLQAVELVKRGHQVRIITYHNRFLFSLSQFDGIEILRFWKPNIKYIGQLIFFTELAIYLLCNFSKFDLYHLHQASPQADFAILIGQALSIPTYVKIASSGASGEIQRFFKFRKFMGNFGLLQADLIQAISDEIKNELLTVGVAENKIIRIPNGVKIKDTYVNKKIKNKSSIFLYLGRIATYKGVDLLIHSWRNSMAKNFNAELWIVGPVAEDSPMVLTNIPTNVKLFPPTNSPISFLEKADVFVLPSKAEGMSNAMLEAMAEGLAIIASDVGAAKELIEENGNGFLFSANDETELSTILNLCLQNSELLKKFGRKSREIVKKYQIEIIVDEIEEQYYRLLINTTRSAKD